MSEITPIQTRYAGCLFRSRLEARWAVFFDHLEVPWRYEHQGYDLGKEGPYLPDFLLYPNTQTAFRFNPRSERQPRSDQWWWTDCPFCGLVILKLQGQVGWCPRFGDDEPPEPLYPRFAHATERLQAAYTAARSARFEHGAHGS